MIKEILDKKRLGNSLTKQELEFVFYGYLNGNVKDYQMSSLLMAICINGMDQEEVFNLVDIFIKSGEVLDFSDIDGVKIDKHSTGGIGDKTTLVIVPIVASLGIPVIKMSGRGLGYTGGTIDKLESIEGFRINLSNDEIRDSVKKIGAVITGQTANLVPLDKAVYALRDVTGTTNSIPLIAVSIMSKKLASGADKILLDVKYGNGALVSNYDDARELGELMVAIGKKYKREVEYFISDMNMPLGECIGNSLEVIEALSVLRGNNEGHFYELCVKLASKMVSMARSISMDDANILVCDALENGKAYNKFCEIVANQGGNIDSIVVSSNTYPIYSKKSGIIKKIDALGIGKLSLSLGAGRENSVDEIDYSVGIVLNKNIGDKVENGDLLMTLYINEFNKFSIDDSIFQIE